MSKKTALILIAAVCVTVCGGVVLALLLGDNHRNSLAFLADAVRTNMSVVNRQMANPTDQQGMRTATDGLYRALAGLPARVETRAEDNVARRLALAMKLMSMFDEIRPGLDSLSFDYNDVAATFAEMDRMLMQIEGRKS